MRLDGPDPARGGSHIPVRELREAARGLDVEEFADRCGSGFLLLTAADLSLPRGPASTEVHLADSGTRRGDSTASLSLLAYPLERRGRSTGHLITVGRASNNDVVIPDLSISRFHAFLKHGRSGAFQVQDAGSTNGTTVNGRSVPQQGNGTAISLKTGDNLRFGQVELTFLEADAMLSFARKLER